MSGIESTECAARTTVKIMRLLAVMDCPLSVQEATRTLNLKEDTARCYLEALENEKFAKAVNGGYEPGDSPAILWNRYKADLESRIEMIKKKQIPIYHRMVINLADWNALRRKGLKIVD
jgi:predicted ArsR family transcriptional regulator